MIALTAGLCGFVFGWGLLISGMVEPAKVLAFLDFAGAWDPSLAVTMAAALAVSAGGHALAARRSPVLVAERVRPAKTIIDRSLVTGALMFGIGWGLIGLCPGPALENVASLSPQALGFVAAMAAGMGLHHLWARRRPAAAPGNSDG